MTNCESHIVEHSSLVKDPSCESLQPFSKSSIILACLVACLVVFEEHLSRLDELIIRRLVQTTTRQSVLCNTTLCAVCAICCVLCTMCYVLPIATCLWRKGWSAEDAWRHCKCSITRCKGPYISAPIHHHYKIHYFSPSYRCVHRAVCDLDCS